MALLAALWLIVAIAAVALQFSLAAHERRELGIGASDRGREIALAAGALSVIQAHMEYDLRNGPTGQAATTASSAADPWFAVDSTYSGTIYVDSFPVDVVAHDLGTAININVAQENDLRVLFGYILGNASVADQLAQSILDWRDVDETARPNGAEAKQYLDDDRLVLPTNGPFREVDDLIHVYGMTPDILEAIRPYITTRGEAQARINLNTAPEAVLRALPGMSDLILANILSMRSNGRRIVSVAQVMAGVTQTLPGGGRGGRGGAPNPQQQQLDNITTQLNSRTTATTTDVELTFFVRDTTRPEATRLIAILTRAGTRSNVTWQLW